VVQGPVFTLHTSAAHFTLLQWTTCQGRCKPESLSFAASSHPESKRAMRAPWLTLTHDQGPPSERWATAFLQMSRTHVLSCLQCPILSHRYSICLTLSMMRGLLAHLVALLSVGCALGHDHQRGTPSAASHGSDVKAIFPALHDPLLGQEVQAAQLIHLQKVCLCQSCV